MQLQAKKVVWLQWIKESTNVSTFYLKFHKKVFLVRSFFIEGKAELTNYRLVWQKLTIPSAEPTYQSIDTDPLNSWIDDAWGLTSRKSWTFLGKRKKATSLWRLFTVSRRIVSFRMHSTGDFLSQTREAPFCGASSSSVSYSLCSLESAI